MAADAYSGLMLTPRTGVSSIVAGTPQTYSLAATNNCWAARFQATDTKDVYKVYLYFSTVTSPGTVQVTVEPDSNPSSPTGVPSGTPYDTHASISFTPVQGWNVLTFATPPSTGRIVGNLYYAVAIATAGGTAQTIRSHYGVSVYPAVALNALDGSTRSNLGEVTGSMPVMALGLSDGSVTGAGGTPFISNTTITAYGTRGIGAKFSVPSGCTWNVAGIELDYVTKAGTPNGLKCSIYSGTSSTPTVTITVPTIAVFNVSTRSIRVPLPVTSLTAGTYRIILEDPLHTTSLGNSYGTLTANAADNSVVPANLTLAGSSNIVGTAGVVTWDLDDATQILPMSLILDDLPAASGGTSTDPGVTNVKSGVAYEINNVNLTGTYDPITGQYTNPGASHVQSGTTYTFAGSSITGIYDPVTGNYTDPGVGNVVIGQTYKFAGTTETGTYAGGMTLSQLQTELTTRGLTTTFTNGFTSTTINGVAMQKVDVEAANGVATSTYDFGVASATNSTITLASTYPDNSSLPDDQRYAYTALLVASGTGANQIVRLTTATATPRQYNVVSGSMPVALDNTSKLSVLGVVRVENVAGQTPPSGWNTDVPQGGDSFSRIGVNGVGLTNVAYTGPSAATIAAAALTTPAAAPSADALDSVADDAITLQHVCWAVMAQIGTNDVSSGTSEVFKTPGGTTLRTAAITASSTNPFGSNYPVKRG